MSDLPVDAHSIPRRNFTVARRGYEQHEVRAYLQQIAEVVARLQRSEMELRERAERSDTRAELAENLDERRLIEIVGEETARVLDAARTAASEIRAKAEESAARLLREGQDEITALRERAEAELSTARDAAAAAAAATQAKADSVLEERTAEAERAAAQLQADTEAEIERMRAEAAREAERAAADASASVEATLAESKRMVAEAQAVRERVLRDLAKRRRAARKQVERLNAGRERLLGAFEAVRRAADDSVKELDSALPEARTAGELAARRVDDELEDTLEALEAEIAAARDAGLVIDAELDLADDDTDDDTGDDEPSDDTGEHDVLTMPGAPRAAVVIDDLADPDSTVQGTSLGAPAEVPSGVPDEPEDDVVERKSSTLRLFRKRSEAVAADADDTAWVEVEQPDEIETVTVVADEVEPEPAPVSEPEPEAVATEPASEPAAEPASEPAEEKAGVDALFAKLRADRGTAAEPLEEPAAEEPAAAEPAAAEAEEPDAEEPEPEPEPEAEDELDPDAAVLAARDAALEPLERDLGKRLKRVLADEQNEVLDRIRRAKPKPKVVDDVVPEPVAHAGVYVDAARDALTAAVTAGAASVSDDGILTNTDAIDALATDLASSLTAPMRERVDRSLEAADGDTDELSERVRALYREWKGQRMNDAARHALAAAYALGAFSAAPRGGSLHWVVDRAGGACTDCDDNAVGGAVEKGSAFPTGDLLPPAHPGCRCLALPDPR